MNDAQTWTVIAGFLAIMAAMSGMLLRIVKVEIGSVKDVMGARFGTVEAKIDHLDRDVQSVVSRLMGDGPTA